MSDISLSPSRAQCSDESRRVSQRQPLACRACTKSKVRCDRNIPCMRCVRRKTPCDREAVRLSGKRRLTTPSAGRGGSERSSPAPAPQSAPAEIPKSSPHLVERQGHERTNRVEDGRSTSFLSFREPPTDVSTVQVKFEDLATCIEGLAWGRHQCQRYPHKSCLRFDPQSDSLSLYLLDDDLLRGLPDVETARRLIEFHTRFLGWYHNVLHVPTFLDQCEQFWQSAHVEDGQWLALYCAVMSASAWSICNFPAYQDRADLLHMSPSPGELFALVGALLDRGEFMARHSVFSLQAICISGMVANVLGKSDLLITWLSAAIRIAQCLGLHRIGDSTSEETWADILEKEIGRRVWWKIIELDYHSIPYTGSYSITLKHCTTKPPGNAGDDLRIQNVTILTSSTYALTQARMATLIPALLDGPSSGQDLSSRYEHVIAIDRRMRRLVSEITPLLLRPSDNGASSPEWLTLARRTLAISAADKIIMIHRAFLLKSFQSPAYLFTRQTCVSAAKTILREHDELAKAGRDCPPIWVHSAFCVAAIVVICLELLYCHRTMQPSQRDSYVHMIRGARQRLSVSKNDTMAHRAVHLVDAMLNEDLYSHSGHESPETNGDLTRHRFTQILHRFIQLDRDDTASGRHSSTNSDAMEEQLNDFEQWFNTQFG